MSNDWHDYRSGDRPPKTAWYEVYLDRTTEGDVWNGHKTMRAEYNVETNSWHFQMRLLVILKDMLRIGVIFPSSQQ